MRGNFNANEWQFWMRLLGNHPVRFSGKVDANMQAGTNNQNVLRF